MGRYTRALLPLAGFVVPYYLIFRISSWAWYVRTLALVGMAVPLFWATIWMKRWANIQDELAYDWELDKLPVDDQCVRRGTSTGAAWRCPPTVMLAKPLLLGAASTCAV